MLARLARQPNPRTGGDRQAPPGTAMAPPPPATCACPGFQPFRGGTGPAKNPNVASPRPIRPLVTYLLTRRCYQRTFRLRPSEETNQIFLYALAWAAAKTGVVIHAACVMSNHHHIVLTDIRGTLPDFARELHRTVAKALNAAQGQWENLWSAEPYHSLELASEEDENDKIAYVAANPTEAGLVEAPEGWPGVMLLPRDEVRSTEIRRPAKYFTCDDVFPETVTLQVTPVLGRQPPEAVTIEGVCTLPNSRPRVGARGSSS